MSKIFVALGEVQAGQVVLGVAQTKTGAVAIAAASVHRNSAQVVTAAVPSPVKVGGRVHTEVILDDGYRIFNRAVVDAADIPPRKEHWVREWIVAK